MKRNALQLLSLLFLLPLLTACNDDPDLPVFRFDGQGICYAPDVATISPERFRQAVVGFGWKHVSTYEITSDGHCLTKEYYQDIVGAGPTQYYFEDDQQLKAYFYIDAIPASGYYTYTYQYLDGNRIMKGNNDLPELQILSIDGDRMTAIRHMGIHSDGTDFYGYVTYHKMTDEELQACQKDYPTDFANVRELQTTVLGHQQVIDGKTFEFEVLEYNNGFTVSALEEDGCDIHIEGNHVTVTLLRNGASITVSDRFRHQGFWIFSTHELLEPEGTDYYELAYPALTLNQNLQLAIPDDYDLSYEYSSQEVHLKKEYNADIPNGFIPTKLVVMKEGTAPRFLQLRGGKVAISKLIPADDLKELATLEAGSTLTYRLELVSAAGRVFQILPFTITYQPVNE